MSDGSGTFWGNARDIGIIVIAALTFAGSVEYFYYLSGMGISVQQATIAPMTVLIMSIGVLLTLVSQYWVVIIALALIILYELLYDRSFRPTLETKALQMALVGLCFVALFFVGRDAGNASVRSMREGKAATLTYLIFGSSSGQKYPQYLSNPDGVHRTFLALETENSVFIFSQDKGAYDSNGYRLYPVGQLFEVNRKDLISVVTYVHDLQVKK